MNDLNKSTEIFCVFRTMMGEAFKIPENPLNLKTASTDRDLNTLVKDFLDKLGKTTQDNFDFIINGEIVKGDLRSHLIKHKIENEKNIIIEYAPALNTPQQDKNVKTENWLNCFKVKDDLLYSCFFDSTVKVFDKELQEKSNFAVIQSEDEFVSNTNAFCLLEQDDKELVLGCNYFGELYSFEPNKQKRVKIGDLETTINCFYTNPFSGNLFCSGDVEGTVSVFNYNFNTKKLQTTKNKEKVHNGAVNGILWLNEQELLTIGLDDQLLISDVSTLKQNYNLYLKDTTPSCVEFSPLKNSILTGHVNGSIRVFDERSRSKKSTGQFKSHKSLVSKILTNLNKPDTFLSADYDGKIKVWDFRTTLPIYTVDAHFGKKVFDMCWLGKLNRRDSFCFWIVVSHDGVQQQQ